MIKLIKRVIKNSIDRVGLKKIFNELANNKADLQDTKQMPTMKTQFLIK